MHGSRATDPSGVVTKARGLDSRAISAQQERARSAMAFTPGIQAGIAVLASMRTELVRTHRGG